MAWQHDTMMNPPIEELLDRADSKFRLVTLGAKRARQINSYFGQLGDGPRHHRPAAGHLRRPASRCRSPSRRSPRTRSTPVDVARGRAPPRRRGRADAERRRRLTTAGPTADVTVACSPGKRIVLGVTGGIAAYKAVEVCRRLVDAGAHVVAGHDRRARSTSSARPPSPRWPPSRCSTSLWDEAEPDPAHPARPGRRPRRRRARPRPGVISRPTPPAAPTTCSPPRCSPPGRRSCCARRCTPRCGSTRRCRRTWRRCGAGACTSSRPRRAASPAATSAPVASPSPTASSRPSSAVLHRRSDLAGLHGARHRRRHPRAASTRCASSATARRASRATPSPTRPPPAGATVTPRHHRRPPGARRRRGRAGRAPPPRWRPRSSPRAGPADVVVMAAAVADFRPVDGRRPRRSRRPTASPEIVLEPTARHPRRPRRGASARPDARRLRRRDRRPRRQRRRTSSRRKGADLIVANDVSAPGAGFEHDTNQVVIISAAGIEHDVALTDKRAIARAVLDAVVADRLRSSGSHPTRSTTDPARSNT